ncbi:MAG: hypothetical protein LBI96_06930 [Odoribacteraceae bacterium]|nr:hypothetical protein [Odoribacteraceae bacterium]
MDRQLSLASTFCLLEVGERQPLFSRENLRLSGKRHTFAAHVSFNLW